MPLIFDISDRSQYISASFLMEKQKRNVKKIDRIPYGVKIITSVCHIMMFSLIISEPTHVLPINMQFLCHDGTIPWDFIQCICKLGCGILAVRRCWTRTSGIIWDSFCRWIQSSSLYSERTNILPRIPTLQAHWRSAYLRWSFLFPFQLSLLR